MFKRMKILIAFVTVKAEKKKVLALLQFRLLPELFLRFNRQYKTTKTATALPV